MAILPSIPASVSPAGPLEWDRFVALLGALAQSSLGRTWIGSLTPSSDRAWIARQHTLVAEMRVLAGSGAVPVTRSLFDPTDLLAKARIEGVALESEELRGLIALADEIASWTDLVRTPPESAKDR